MFWDVDRRLEKEISMLSQQSTNCKYEYEVNYCSMSESLPAGILEKCQELAKCMNFNPHDHNLYSKITAGMIAEIINDFFETISYNTIAKFLIILIICMVVEIPYAQFLRMKLRGFKLF